MVKLRYHLRKKSDGGGDDTVKEGLLNDNKQKPMISKKPKISTNISKLLQFARKKTNSTTKSSSSTFADHIVIDEVVQSSNNTYNKSSPQDSASPSKSSKRQNKQNTDSVPLKKSISWVDDVVTSLSSPVADAINPNCRLPLDGSSDDDSTGQQQQPYDEVPASSGLPSCRLSFSESLDVVPDFNDVIVPTRSSRSKDTVEYEGLTFSSGESTASLSSISSEEGSAGRHRARRIAKDRRARRTSVKGRGAKARKSGKGSTNLNSTTNWSSCFEIASFITQPLLDIFDTKYCGCVRLSSVSKEGREDEEVNGINMYDYQIVNVIQH